MFTHVRSESGIIYTSVNMATDFIKWLTQQMDRQDNMSQAELSRASGLSDGMISHLLAGTRKPTAQSCAKLARALNLPPDDVQRAAGLLPSKRSDYSPEIIALVEMYEVLPEEIRDHIRELVQGFHKRYKN